MRAIALSVSVSVSASASAFALALLTLTSACGLGPSGSPAPGMASAPVSPSSSPATLPSTSPENAPPRAPLDGTQSYTIPSKNVDQTFRIDVWAPYGTTDPLPVVYVLDGNVMFATAMQAALQMIYARELPPMILVGIGYQTDNPFDAGVLRVRDLTPTHSATYEKRASAGLPIPESIRSGGADRFLAFIDEELKPFIAARYAVDPTDSTLVGHSLGGLFTMHVALESTPSFERYLIGSPYLAWDDDLLFAIEEAHAQNVSHWPVRIFLSVGELETGIRDTYHRMAPILRARGYTGLELMTHEFTGETHVSVLGATMSRGLRALFPSPGTP